jgi:hypothetical protein
VLILTLAGCGSQSTESGSASPSSPSYTSISEAGNQESVPDVSLEEIAAANDAQALLNNYDFYTTVIEDELRLLDDGSYGKQTLTTVRARWDGQVGVHTISGDGYEEVIVADGRYYSKDTDGALSVAGFIEDGYFEQSLSPFLRSVVLFNPDEEIASTYIEGEYLVVETQINTSAFPAEEVGGKTDGTIQFLFYLDAESYLIHRSVENHIDNSGSLTLLSAMNVSYDGDEAYPMPGFVDDCEDTSGGSRTVTCVYNPGSPDEKSYTREIPVAVRLRSDLTVDTWQSYSDPACTQPFEGFPDGSSPSEYTVYFSNVTAP